MLMVIGPTLGGQTLGRQMKVGQISQGIETSVQMK